MSEIVEEILGATPGLTIEEILDRAYDDGWDLGDHPEDEVQDELEDDERPYLPLDDGRWAFLPSLLDGRIFTHRVSETELQHDVLRVEPDLTLLQMLAEYPPHDRLRDGGEVGFGYPQHTRPGLREVPDDAIAELGSFILPVGTLRSLGRRADELVALRYGSSTGIEVLPVDEPEASSEELRDYVLERLAEVSPQECDDLLVGALVGQPELFRRPAAPIGELLSSWEVDDRDGLVAAPDFDWTSWRPYAATLAARYELTDDEADAVATLLKVVSASQVSAELLRDRIAGIGVDPRTIDGADLSGLLDEVAATAPVELPDPAAITLGLELLHDPHLAYVLLRESLRHHPEHAAAGLAAAAETLRSMSPRRSRAALHWLQARAHDLLGQVFAHEEQLRLAERLDPDYYPATVDLARLAGDRGDVVTGLALLSRVPDDIAVFLRSALEDHRPQPARVMPRNEPCWCGSGRKFKACHLRRTDRPPLADRTTWLYQKAMIHAIENDYRQVLEELIQVRVAHVESEDLARQAADDGLIVDVVLFEGGALEEFVESRGSLLPADELLLAQQWLLTERSAYEVVDVDPGVAVTFRDLRTGDVVRASDLLASRALQVGQLVCCHLLPLADDDHAIHSIDPIALHERSVLLELLDDEDTSPAVLVAFLSRHLAPPTVVNSEGHQLVMCEVRLQVPDPARLAAVLDERYESAELDDELSWFDNIELDEEVRLRGTLTLEDDILLLRTNSVARRELMLADLRQLAPDLELVSQTSEPAASLRAKAGAAPDSAPDSGGAFGQPLGRAGDDDLLADDPAVQSAVAEHVRGYEERWLDLDIPALEGLTPRQAAADPTRRDDLRRLLATFPAAKTAMDMDPARLRTMLGL